MDPNYIERYKRLNSFTFAGVSSFEEAEYWLAEPENAFTTLGVIPEQRVILVTYMLVREVGCWWQLKQATLPVSVTWEQFLIAFNTEYLSKHLQYLKKMEFAHLVQGDMTILEYVWKFIELGWYSSESMMDEGGKARKFE